MKKIGQRRFKNDEQRMATAKQIRWLSKERGMTNKELQYAFDYSKACYLQFLETKCVGSKYDS